MAGNPQVLGLLEEMLDSGKTPEEVCRDAGVPELLPEVRRRWQEFQLIDAQVRTLFPGLGRSSDAATTAPHGSMATIRDKMGHSGVKLGQDSVLRWPATGPQEVTAASSGPRALCSQSGGNRERTSPSA